MKLQRCKNTVHSSKFAHSHFPCKDMRFIEPWIRPLCSVLQSVIHNSNPHPNPPFQVFNSIIGKKATIIKDKTFHIYNRLCGYCLCSICYEVHQYHILNGTDHKIFSQQISYASTSPALSEREKFTTFFRLAPTDSSYNTARSLFIRHFGWSTVGTIHQNQETFDLVVYDLTLCITDKHFVVCS